MLEFAHPFPLSSEVPIASANFISDGYMWGCFIIHTHEGACPTNGGSVIQDQRVSTIRSLSSQTLSGAVAFYQRVGFEIPKWHTRIQKSVKSPPPKGDDILSPIGLKASTKY